MAHNVTALQQQEYLLVSRCIALALVYDGGAPHFFSEAVVSYLLDEPINESAIDDIPDRDQGLLFDLVSHAVFLW